MVRSTEDEGDRVGMVQIDRGDPITLTRVAMLRDLSRATVVRQVRIDFHESGSVGLQGVESRTAIAQGGRPKQSLCGTNMIRCCPNLPLCMDLWSASASVRRRKTIPLHNEILASPEECAENRWRTAKNSFRRRRTPVARVAGEVETRQRRG